MLSMPQYCFISQAAQQAHKNKPASFGPILQKMHFAMTVIFKSYTSSQLNYCSLLQQSMHLSASTQPKHYIRSSTSSSFAVGPRAIARRIFSSFQALPQVYRGQSCQDLARDMRSGLLSLSANFSKKKVVPTKESGGVHEMVGESQVSAVKQAKNDTKIDSRKVGQPTQLSFWECPNSHKTDGSSCKICRGTNQTSQDTPLIKFFLYVLEFKLKAAQPARKCQKQLPTQLPAKKQPKFKYRLSSCSTLQSRVQVIHLGYYCNGCGVEQPIRGVRYNCLGCPDYDLCSDCYEKRGHQHRMERVEEPAGYKRAERVAQSMRAQGCLRSSLREASSRLLRLEQELLRRSTK